MDYCYEDYYSDPETDKEILAEIPVRRKDRRKLPRKTDDVEHMPPWHYNAGKRKCVKCGVYGRLLTICIGCLNDQIAIHSEFEDIWDIDAEDFDKLTDSAIQEEVVMLSLGHRGVLAAREKWGFSAESVKWMLRHHRKRVSEGDVASIAMETRAKARREKGDHLPYMDRLPPPEKKQPGTSERTQRRRDKFNRFLQQSIAERKANNEHLRSA